ISPVKKLSAYDGAAAGRQGADMPSQFIRKTTLAPDEYQARFTITDNDIIDAVTSDEALGRTALMPAIYFRMKRAPVELWEREGVLRFTGGDADGKVITAWEQLRKLAGVSNSTLSKAVKWMHEKGVIGYVAHKNGIGIRIFFNRAAASIRRREGQKNLRLLPAPPDDSPAPQNGTAFKEEDPQKNRESYNYPRACAREEDPSSRERSDPPTSTEIRPPAQPDPQPDSARQSGPDLRLVTLLIRQIVTELKPEITSAVRRENEGTREWFLNHALPKATRVAQRETYDLLRAHGVITKKSRHSVDVGSNHVSSQTGQGREAETARLAAFLAETSKAIRQAVATTSSGTTTLHIACRIVDRELGELHDRIISGEQLRPDEIANRLAAAEDAITKALWESTGPADSETMLSSARVELRGYETRME